VLQAVDRPASKGHQKTPDTIVPSPFTSAAKIERLKFRRISTLPASWGNFFSLPQLSDFVKQGLHELALAFSDLWVTGFKDRQIGVKETFQSRFRFRKQLRTSHPEPRTHQ
jgi:hypothetical protein